MAKASVTRTAAASPAAKRLAGAPSPSAPPPSPKPSPSAAPLSAVGVDLTFALDGALGDGRGIARAAYDAAAAQGATLVAAMEDERRAGRAAFLDLPTKRELVAPVITWAKARRATTTDVLLIGIGGSSRGATVLAAARKAGTKPGLSRPRLHVLDTVDPHRVRDLLAILPARTTTVVAVSKAGTTIETVSGLLVVERWLERALGAATARARVAVVCGEEENPLRDRARTRGYAIFPVPSGVGGRFSVLAPVGLLPAALLGVDVAKVLAGAALVVERSRNPDASQNPPLSLALVHYLAAMSNRPTTVCLPYADALAPYALWWEQLVAESLGKKRGTATYGVTPVPGVGPSDQHSLLQLLMEGPDDKLVVFIEALDRAKDVLSVPKGGESLSAAASGRRLGAILAAEREGTELALAEAGRPSVTIRIPDTSASSLGSLLMLYEIATMLWGRMAGVNPFDQPGVQRGKLITEASLTGSPADGAAALAKHRQVARVVSR